VGSGERLVPSHGVLLRLTLGPAPTLEHGVRRRENRHPGGALALRSGPDVTRLTASSSLSPRGSTRCGHCWCVVGRHGVRSMAVRVRSRSDVWAAGRGGSRDAGLWPIPCSACRSTVCRAVAVPAVGPAVRHPVVVRRRLSGGSGVGAFRCRAASSGGGPCCTNVQCNRCATS